MKGSIKLKFVTGLALIFIIFGVLINLLIKEVLKENLENTIRASCTYMLKSTDEYIKSSLNFDNLPPSSDAIKLITGGITSYIDENYGAKAIVLNMKGSDLNSIKKPDFVVNASVNQAIKGASVVDLNYTSKGLNAVFTFPICVNNQYLGLISMNKSYEIEYSLNRKTLLNITLLEFTAFVIIFILALVFMSHMMKPLIKLKAAMRSLGKGNFDAELEAKGEDEISLLTKEFMDMKSQLKLQLEKIQKGKEKELEEHKKSSFSHASKELEPAINSISRNIQMLIYGNTGDEAANKEAIEEIYMESEKMKQLLKELSSKNLE